MEEQQVAISQYPTPTPSKRFPWKKPILILVAFLIIFGGIGSVLAWRTTYLDNYLPAGVKEFFGRGEEVGKEGEAKEEEVKVGEAVGAGGLLLTVSKAERVIEESGTKDILVLTVTFENQGDCPPQERAPAECRYDTRGFRLVDEEGFVLDQPVKYPTIEYYETDPLSQLVLKAGEKDQGHVFFEIPKGKIKFFLTYTQFQETSSKILIEPEVFDKTAKWKTYKNTTLGFSIKYPSNYVPEEGTPESGMVYFEDEETGDKEKLMVAKNFSGGWACTKVISTEEITVDRERVDLDIHSTMLYEGDECTKVDLNGDHMGVVSLDLEPKGTGKNWFFKFGIDRSKEAEEISLFKTILSTFKRL